MKKLILQVFLLSFLLVACAQAASTETSVVLSITDGKNTKTFTSADLQALEQTTVEDKGIQYVGISLATLLRHAGFDPQTISMVQAVASDGFSADYTPDLIADANIVLAYARTNGPLSADEAPFRMVSPGQAGKLNPRMVVELRIVYP